MISRSVSLFVAIAALFSTPVLAQPGQPSSIPESKNRLIKLTDKGPVPPVLHMKREDSIAFFLNKSTDSLTTLELDFGGKKTHCASGNLTIVQSGLVRSSKPFAPGDFASTCFHERGTYGYKVFGLKSNPGGIAGTIVVE